MYNVEVTATAVRAYLDHSPQSATRWTFEEVMRGALERSEVRYLFSDEEIAAMKAEARSKMAAKP